MEIKIKYTVSERKHSMILSEAELNEMKESGVLEVTQPTPKGSKTFEILGTDREKRLFAEAILDSLE
ncbi:MAG: hypothetical protein ABIK28_07325 [Planctomycetota bacterium]|jgi:hypothetical protein